MSDKVPALVNQRVGLIDPDTPKTDDVRYKTDANGKKLKLVVCFVYSCEGPNTDICSFRMSSIRMGGLFTMRTIRIGKQWTSGTELLKTCKDIVPLSFDSD